MIRHIVNISSIQKIWLILLNTVKSSLDDQQLERMKVKGGEACIKTGYWRTPAQPDLRQYFKQGEIVPAFIELDWGEYIGIGMVRDKLII